MEIVVFVFMLACYFLPTLIAWNKTNLRAIFALNLLTGWTLIGWVISFVWSLLKD